MKLFKLIDLHSDASTDYFGEEEGGALKFSAVDNSEETVEITRLSEGGVHLRRQTADLTIEGDMFENRLSYLTVGLKSPATSGEFPILVRQIKIDYPRSVRLVYQLLGDKNVPVDTCEILIAEKI